MSDSLFHTFTDNDRRYLLLLRHTLDAARDVTILYRDDPGTQLMGQRKISSCRGAFFITLFLPGIYVKYDRGGHGASR